MRSALESAAARLAAQRIQPSDIVKLRSLHNRFLAVAASRKPDVNLLREINEEFHFAIYDATRSPLLRRIIRTAWNVPADVFGVLPLTKSEHDHTALINALEAGDADLAEEVMRAHIQASAKILLPFTKHETEKKHRTRRKSERKT